MATTYQCNHGRSQPVVLLTVMAGVHLMTPHGNMTKNYEAAIRYQATKPGLDMHIQEGYYGWSDHVISNVNWTAHGSSLHEKISTEDTPYKFGSWYPTNRETCAPEGPTPQKCHLCLAAKEERVLC